MLSATRKNNFTQSTTQSGFTLIEALVAAFVLAIGIMGIVTLLSFSKVSQHEAVQRARAVALADDILERIRRNPAGMSVYDTGLTTPLGGGSITAEPDPNCNSASCTALELATHDLWVWERLLDGNSTFVTADNAPTAGMRNVSACVEFTPDFSRTNTGIVDVVIQWQGLKETTDAVVSGGTVCGNAAAEDATRRQVIVNSYVVDELEL